jgi:small subunit ribosomal protein S25e
MPGKKSLKKQEKQQETKSKEDVKSKEKREKIIGAVEISDTSSDEVMSTLRKMKAITPTSVATQFNLKVSVAKKMLKDLEQNGTLAMAARSHNVKVYALNEN